MNNLMTKSFMSYVDLKKEALKDLEAGGGGEDEAAAIEMAATIGKVDANLGHFFEEAGLVKEEMASIRALLVNLQDANEESKSLHKPDSLRSHRNRINSDIVQVLRKAKAIRDRLEVMDRANAANRRLSGFREGTPIDRTRTSVTNGLRKKLRELMMDFQGLRQRMMAEYKETVERRYFTVAGEVPEEEVIEKIISEGASEELFSKAISEHGSGKVLETVHEIQDRHDAAKEIERSLLELHQVFLDMAVMVEAQGETMDDIEHHVTNAAQYVKDGAKELKSAKDYQRSSRKWLCIGLILLLIIILVIVVPVATSLSKS
ncbi:syntaxin 1B/2/3 protein [Dioscorea alata]|uniref:Syntaxin-related protein KNOLLE n=2 Tax=Dioscorea TaxID=4672 RepID=A0AB40BM75_DIOCR|nr:syntaxin-related protein KNOLLE [Dioscorea cayenensis subsp. rotundata]KAH7676216.1 syntaxin 1B/2/3 protein [Dioscorea alata]